MRVLWNFPQNVRLKIDLLTQLQKLHYYFRTIQNCAIFVVVEEDARVPTEILRKLDRIQNALPNET